MCRKGACPTAVQMGWIFYKNMEHIALYRQFRPNNFDEIVEQKAPVTALRQAVKTGRIGHAYLFCGQRGTGKTSIARVFSRAINCESPKNGNPCNKCPTCKGILDGSLMDVIEIDAASNRSIDNIRKICEEVTYSPSKAPYKVYIIDEVHMITNDAFNALLKTLEEPPKHAVFLFATTEPHSIPATILSRCQRFDFRRISLDAIIGRLKQISKEEKIDISDDALRLIASMSDGAMRDAISILDQAASAKDGGSISSEDIESMTGTVNTEFLADMAQILIDGRFDDLLIKCGELADSGRDSIRFALDLADYFRNLLIVRTVPDPSALIPASPTTLERMYRVANTTNSQTLVGFITTLSKIISDLKWSPSVRTSFEIALLRLCGRKVRLEEAPLVVPDFSKKQAEAAKKISEGTSSLPPIARSVEKKEEEPKAEEKKPEPQPGKKEEPAKEEVKEEKKEEAKPEEKKDEKPDPFEAIKARINLIKAGTSEPSKEEKKEEPAKEEKKPEEDKKEEEKKPEPEIIMHDLPAPEEEEEEDNTPPENQMDIFSMSSEPAPAPAPSPAPAPKAEEDTGSHIFAGLGSSFMDDLDVEEEEEEKTDIYEPTGRIGETRKTALSAAVEANPIVKRKETELPVFEEGTDPSIVWNTILGRVEKDDFILHSMLSRASLLISGDSAYVTFDDSEQRTAKQIQDDPNFRKVSSEIKAAMPEIGHVYLCTMSQYRKYARSSTGGHTAPAPQAGGVDDYINRSKEMGINTEIHFGDD